MFLLLQKTPKVLRKEIKQIRLLELFPHHQLEEAYDYVQEGGDLFPNHHFWGYDQFKAQGYDMRYIDIDRNAYLNRWGRKRQIGNFQQQIDCLRRSKDYDMVFDPFMEFTFFLALLKVCGLYRKPIVAIAHKSYAPNTKHPLRRLKQSLVRYVYQNGIDLILFLNEKLWAHHYEGVQKRKHQYLNTWGVDFDFFDRYVQQQAEPPKGDYLYATGGTSRDFETLIRAFHDTDFKLRVTARDDFSSRLQTSVPDNVFIDTSITPGLRSVGLIRKEYYNSLAVAVPLMKEEKYDPYGITVLLEGMAMGKPVITSDNPAYPFDVEKEKVGLKVDFGDVNGWRQAVEYLRDNPDEAREMGLRGRQLCKEKYNYDQFMTDLSSKMNAAFEKK